MQVFTSGIKQRARQLSLTALGVALLPLTTAVQAADVDAGDYVPAPVGTNLGILYYQHAERNALYSDGHKAPVKAGLNSDIGILRMVHYMDIGGFTVDPQFLLPFGKLKAKRDLSDLGSDSGIGDLILAATVWLVNEPEQRRYFGLTPYLYAPTGSYDHKDAINLGENRWKMTLQGGYVQGLTDKLWLELIGDVTFFNKNDEFGPNKQTLKQEKMYQGQAFVRYQLNDKWDLRAGVSRLWGGETKVDGQWQKDKPNTSKYTLGSAYSFDSTTQLIVSYGRDLSVDNGFKENNRLNLRLLKAF